MSRTITIQNVGPITRADIPAPEGGGVVVFQGRNGIGKTSALEAIETALDGKNRLSIRDGADRAEVSGLGVNVTFARRLDRRGVVEVQTLSGRLSISELIDPQKKDPGVCDAFRIKALIGLAAVEPSLDLFADLLGGREQAETLVTAAALTRPDLVGMCDTVKGDLEKKARELEDGAEKAEGRAVGARDAAAGVDHRQSVDVAALNDALENAIRAEADLQARAAAAVRAADRAASARADLEDAQAEYTGPGVEDARDAESQAEGAALIVAEEMRQLVASVNECRRRLDVATERKAAATQKREAAERHEKTVAQFREALAKSIPIAPSDEQLVAARRAIVAAREAVAAGAAIRQARDAVAKAEAASREAVELRTRAASLRHMARGTDGILSAAVGRLGTPLRVVAGRLVVETRRGPTHYHDLSAGERTVLAIDIGVNVAGAAGGFVLDQELWEGLDPQNRELVADHAHTKGVTIWTAEATADESLTVAVFPEQLEACR